MQGPNCQVLLRIRADDPTAKMQFGSKYGVGMKAVPRLLQVAKVLGLRIAGQAVINVLCRARINQVLRLAHPSTITRSPSSVGWLTITIGGGVNDHHVSRAQWGSMNVTSRKNRNKFSLWTLYSGVSFHVGSGSADNFAYDRAIAQAKQVFHMAVGFGHPMPTLLDIGGGFTSAFVGTTGEAPLARS